ITTLVVSFGLYQTSHHDGFDSFRMAIFQVVSIFTTTGFATEDFSKWPSMLPYLVFFGAFTGACAGSTGGGMKVMRVMLICKQGLREIPEIICDLPSPIKEQALLMYNQAVLKTIPELE
ncbi:MAG: potassium transporter TrkG, partial [Pseudoalteromonas marina]